MDERKRKRRDFIQNISITLLSLLAVVLFVRTQAYTGNISGEFFSSLRSTTAASPAANTKEKPAISAPVRAAVSGSYGRYGSITLTTTAEEFSPLSTLLGNALSSAQMYTSCTADDLTAALDYPSVYFDFLHPLPLSFLGVLTGGAGEKTISARHLILTALNGNSVFLYLWDHGERYLRCTTNLSVADLDSIIGLYEQGNAEFAMDTVEHYGEYAVHPLSLFLAQPQLPILSAASSPPSDRRILSALSFNPHTQTRWTEPSGTEVIVDGDRTLRLRTDGSLYYQSGGSGELSISAAGETPTVPEAVSQISALLKNLSDSTGSEQLYLCSVTEGQNMLTLLFDYHYNGIPVHLASGNAARVVLSGTTVSTLSFLPRQYHSTDETGLLLPLQQALAVSAHSGGKELLIGYADYGTASVSPQWLVE